MVPRFRALRESIVHLDEQGRFRSVQLATESHRILDRHRKRQRKTEEIHRDNQAVDSQTAIKRCCPLLVMMISSLQSYELAAEACWRARDWGEFLKCIQQLLYTIYPRFYPEAFEDGRSQVLHTFYLRRQMNKQQNRGLRAGAFPCPDGSSSPPPPPPPNLLLLC